MDSLDPGEHESKLREFYKEHYFNELKRRDDFGSRITLPLGVLSILVGGFVAAFREVKRPETPLDIAIIVLLAVAALLAGLVVVNLWRSYHDNAYWVIATPAEISRYRHGLEDYYSALEAASETNTMQLALAEVLEYIDSEYAKHADHNSRVNERRSHFLHVANKFLAVTLAVAAITLALQLTRLAKEPDRPQMVRITNPRDFIMSSSSSDPSKKGDSSASAVSGTPSKPPVPQKPLPPPGRLIREDSDPGMNRR